MTASDRPIRHRHEDVELEAVLSVDGAGPRPAVLVFHGMEGRSEMQVEFARRLTEWGYAGFAADLFGIGDGGDVERGGPLMNRMIADRAFLRDRLAHVVDVVRDLPEVDPSRVAAIGFCFGGLCALELARSGIDVRGVASFHGVLTAAEGFEATDVPAKVIVFHGWDDPFAPPQDVVALGRELTDAGADWQLHAYGDTMHSFMAPTAQFPERGISYNETSARRAWASLGTFLEEIFRPTA